jgi:hypothetical protein
MRSMKQMGMLSSRAVARPMRQTHVCHRAVPSPLADKVFDIFIEKLIERSAFALVGALL